MINYECMINRTPAWDDKKAFRERGPEDKNEHNIFIAPGNDVDWDQGLYLDWDMDIALTVKIIFTENDSEP